MGNSRIKTCFISAPFNAKIDYIQQSLLSRGVRVLGLEDAPLGSTLFDSFVSTIDGADLLIAVLAPGFTSRRSAAGNVLFELGYAVGKGKQILVFAPPKSDLVPYELQQYLTVRTTLDNHEAIDFAISQVLSAPERSSFSRTEPERLGRSLGDTVVALIANYRSIIAGRTDWELEELISKAIRDSGVELISEPFREHGRVDLIVWSDDLQPSVGNPLLIEVKQRLGSRSQFRQATDRLARATEAAGSTWSLLIYGEAPGNPEASWSAVPTVLFISVEQLLEAMRHASFVDIIRDLRNRRAHGGA